MTNLLDNIEPAATVLQNALGDRSPAVAFVLGSGFSELAQELDDVISVPYASLPGFVAAGIEGHAGVVYSGFLYGHDVLMFAGRYHVYEGYSAWQVSALVRLAALVGCRHLLLTNAAGGIDDQMKAGDFMLITDHINLTGLNPFIGRKNVGFPDLHGLYQHDFYIDLQQQLHCEEMLTLHSGVLAWLTGPSYETPAEIRMLETLGCGAVSMSTVPEAIVAKALDLNVVALSFIANQAAGKCLQPLSHIDVLNQADKAKANALKVVNLLLKFWLAPSV